MRNSGKFGVHDDGRKVAVWANNTHMHVKLFIRFGWLFFLCVCVCVCTYCTGAVRSHQTLQFLGESGKERGREEVNLIFTLARGGYVCERAPGWFRYYLINNLNFEFSTTIFFLFLHFALCVWEGGPIYSLPTVETVLVGVCPNRFYAACVCVFVRSSIFFFVFVSFFVV